MTTYTVQQHVPETLRTVAVTFGATAANDDHATPPPAAPAARPTHLDRAAVLALFANGFAGVTFTKRDGTERRMVARTGVRRHLTGTSTPEQRAARDEANGIVTVWSPGCGYRSIRVDSITELRAGGERYVPAADLALAA